MVSGQKTLSFREAVAEAVMPYYASSCKIVLFSLEASGVCLQVNLPNRYSGKGVSNAIGSCEYGILV
jgi:hypothetical protein